MIAALLVFVGFGISLRNDFAEVRNSKAEAADSLRQYLKFTKYDRGECTGDSTCNGDLYGDEVIAVIREYYNDPDFEIYVDKASATGSAITVNSVTVNEHPEDFTVEHLQDVIPSMSRFHPYLVYNGVYAETVSSEQVGRLGNVTGISFIWVQD